MGFPSSHVLFLVLAMLAGLGQLRAAVVADPADLFAQRSAAVVALTCNGPHGMLSYYGTGAVVSADGYVLSNITVIPTGARDIVVYFSDGRQLPAQLIATDQGSEAALIKVEMARDSEPLAWMPIADSTSYRVCDPVYSWGNPHGSLQQDGVVSFSDGIISGRYHCNSSDSQSRYSGPVLECDAAVNPGSDGGPITDAKGNVIGIMSLAFTDSRWLGLAIPTEVMIAAVPAIRRLASGKRPDLATELAGRWPVEATAQRLLPKIAPSVVSLRRRGQSDEPGPERRPPLAAARGPIPDDRQRQMELVIPTDLYVSGFICDPQGLILTTAIWLPDDAEPTGFDCYDHEGKRHACTLLGKDRRADVALFRIESDRRDWPALTVAGDDEYRSGTSVILPGRSEAPGNLTCTLGRISAVHRNRTMAYQVSCLMNYGNIGSPVLDLEGQVVGMACWLNGTSLWRQNCGVGFALRPSQLHQAVIALREGRAVELPERPFIGVRCEPDEAGGIRLLQILPESAASKAGLKVGDRITALSGTPTPDWISFSRALEHHQPGETVPITVHRDGQTLSLQLTLGSWSGA